MSQLDVGRQPTGHAREEPRQLRRIKARHVKRLRGNALQRLQQVGRDDLGPPGIGRCEFHREIAECRLVAKLDLDVQPPIDRLHAHIDHVQLDAHDDPPDRVATGGHDRAHHPQAAGDLHSEVQHPGRRCGRTGDPGALDLDVAERGVNRGVDLREQRHQRIQQPLIEAQRVVPAVHRRRRRHVGPQRAQEVVDVDGAVEAEQHGPVGRHAQRGIEAVGPRGEHTAVRCPELDSADAAMAPAGILQGEGGQELVGREGVRAQRVRGRIVVRARVPGAIEVFPRHAANLVAVPSHAEVADGRCRGSLVERGLAGRSVADRVAAARRIDHQLGRVRRRNPRREAADEVVDVDQAAEAQQV